MLRKHLHDVGVRTHRDVTLTDVAEKQVSGYDEFEAPWALEVDALVLVTQQESESILYRSLVSDPTAVTAAGIEGVFCIGDAVSPRMISEAIFDGHRLAREIDSVNPAMPQPYLPERPIP